MLSIGDIYSYTGGLTSTGHLDDAECSLKMDHLSRGTHTHIYNIVIFLTSQLCVVLAVYSMKSCLWVHKQMV